MRDRIFYVIAVSVIALSLKLVVDRDEGRATRPSVTAPEFPVDQAQPSESARGNGERSYLTGQMSSGGWMTEEVSGGYVVYRGTDLQQTVGFYAADDSGPRTLLAVTRERSAADPTLWRASDRTLQASSDIVCVAGRTFNDFLVVLDGGDVWTVERWILPFSVGARVSTTDIYDVGVSAPEANSVEFIFGQSTWIDPSTRKELPEKRVKLHSLGKSDGAVLSASVDPQGRFYVLAQEAAINAYALSGTPTLAIWSIAQSGVAIDLASIYGTNLGEHATLGRVHYFSGMHASGLLGGDVVVFDASNDGVIDGAVVVDEITELLSSDPEDVLFLSGTEPQMTRFY